MARFHFRLEQLLKWRERQCEVEELELQRIRARHDSLLTQIRNLEDDRRAAEHAMAKQSVVQAVELAALSGFMQGSRESMQRLKVEAEQSHKELDAQRDKLMELMRKKKLLERLKERKLTEWSIEEDREQERFTSEIHLIRRVRENAVEARRKGRADQEAPCR